jgi:uncharacterized protein YaiI (UPF0178 family)
MSTPNVIATTNNTNVVVTTSTNNENVSSQILLVNATTNNSVVVQQDYPLTYNAGSGIQLVSNVIHNNGVLSFNSRIGNIMLNNIDINNALGYVAQPSGLIDGGTP